MKAHLPGIALAMGLAAVLGTASLANDPAGTPPAASPKTTSATPAPKVTPTAPAAPAPSPASALAPRDAASGQATGKRSTRPGPADEAKPRVFKKVGTGEVFTPEPGAATKKWKDCTYDEKGRVTNAPCTGTKKDDKGVTWWPA